MKSLLFSKVTTIDSFLYILDKLFCAYYNLYMYTI